MKRQRLTSNPTGTVLPESIEHHIHLIRGQKVMLDGDLAHLFRVETKKLNQAVKRNRERFPVDFMFQLSATEAGLISRSQIVTLKQGGNIKYLPYVFTEQGVAMLSSVLNSPRAIPVNIQIIRVFTRIRQILAMDQDLSRKIDKIEQKLGQHDGQIKTAFQALRQLLAPPERPRRTMGFKQ
jgi:hypothetical protein